MNGHMLILLDCLISIRRNSLIISHCLRVQTQTGSCWFCRTGPEWYRIRSVLNPKMLKLREVSAYAPIIHQVVGDLLRRVELLRSRSPDRATVPDLAAELYKFGFEGGGSCRLFCR